METNKELIKKYVAFKENCIAEGIFDVNEILDLFKIRELMKDEMFGHAL